MCCFLNQLYIYNGKGGACIITSDVIRTTKEVTMTVKKLHPIIFSTGK